MNCRLEDLPVELIENITTLLELCDVASLRLTSRTIKNKASQGSFTAFYKQKDVKLTLEALKDMVRMTSQGWLGSLLQRCTITGIITTATSTVDGGTELLSLLTEAFNNLKHHSTKDGLVSLQLRVAAMIENTNGEITEAETFRSWRAIWEAALHTFNITMKALFKSQLSVSEHLDLFSSVRGCSLACDAFLTSVPRLASVQTFKHLKELTVSLSAPHTPATEQQIETAATGWDFQGQTRNSDLTLHSIMWLSLVMPDLESLDLHWYNIGEKILDLPIQSAAGKETGNSLAFKKLRACSLHGIYASESDLLHFLKTLHPTTISMTDVRLVSGAWASILNYLTSSDSPVTSFHLDDIREGIALVHFDMPGTPKFRYKGRDVGPSTLTRQTRHVKNAINYHFATGRPLGSGERLRWLKSKAEELGPPNDRKYDFVKLNSRMNS